MQDGFQKRWLLADSVSFSTCRRCICNLGLQQARLARVTFQHPVDGRRKLTKTFERYLPRSQDRGHQVGCHLERSGAVAEGKEIFRTARCSLGGSALYCIILHWYWGEEQGHLDGLLGEGSTGNTPKCERNDFLLASGIFRFQVTDRCVATLSLPLVECSSGKEARVDFDAQMHLVRHRQITVGSSPKTPYATCVNDGLSKAVFLQLPTSNA